MGIRSLLVIGATMVLSVGDRVQWSHPRYRGPLMLGRVVDVPDTGFFFVQWDSGHLSSYSRIHVDYGYVVLVLDQLSMADFTVMC